MGFLQPGEEKVLGRPYCNLSIESYKKDGERLFTKVCGGKTKGNGFILKAGRFRLETRKIFFTVRVIRHCFALRGC